MCTSKYTNRLCTVWENIARVCIVLKTCIERDTTVIKYNMKRTRTTLSHNQFIIEVK